MEDVGVVGKSCDTSWLSEKTNKAADKQQIFIIFGLFDLQMVGWHSAICNFRVFKLKPTEGKMKHDLRSLDLARPFWNGDVWPKLKGLKRDLQRSLIKKFTITWITCKVGLYQL